MHLGLRATRRLDCGARRAALGLRAVDHRATRSRAWRTFADLAGLVARADAGRACRDSRLEDVAAHVGWRGALGLEHIATHIRLRRAWGNRGLQYILGPVDLGALVALGPRAGARARAVTMVSGATTDFTRALSNIYKSLNHMCRSQERADH